MSHNTYYVKYNIKMGVNPAAAENPPPSLP